VRASWRPERRNPSLPFVRSALIAAWCKDQWARLFAALRVCRDSVDLEAVAVLSPFNALDVARERLGEVFRFPDRPFAKSRFACFRILLLPRRLSALSNPLRLAVPLIVQSQSLVSAILRRALLPEHDGTLLEPIPQPASKEI